MEPSYCYSYIMDENVARGRELCEVPRTIVSFFGWCFEDEVIKGVRRLAGIDRLVAPE